MLVLSLFLIATCFVSQSFSFAQGFCLNACSLQQNIFSDGLRLVRHTCGCSPLLSSLEISLLNALETTSPLFDQLLPESTTNAGDDGKAQQFGLTSSKATTTEDICDVLCGMQLGGDACLCSHPNLPGR